MRAWAVREGLDLVYEDASKTVVDWPAVYANWAAREDGD